MSANLEELIAKLGGNTVYQGLSSEDIMKQATDRYQSVYGQKRLSARQAYETSDAALARELGSLQQSYDAQRAQSRAQTESTYRQADRHALGRGMQRSSYNEATLANIDLAGDEALDAISQAQTNAEADVQQKRTQLADQLAGTIKQMNADEQSDILAYADELEAREYDRRFQSQQSVNEISMKIYEYQHQLEQEAIEQERWLAEFNAKYGGKSSGSSGSSGGGGSRKKKQEQPTVPAASRGSASVSRKTMLY